jgi:hypothetical protein
MNQSKQEPPDPEMLALLRAEFEHADSAAKERVSTRLAQSVGFLSLSRASATRTPIAKSSAASFLAAFRAYPLGFVASFSVGTALGAGLYAQARRTEPARTAYVDRAVSPSATIVVASPAPPRQEITPTSTAPAPLPSSPVAVPVPSASAERAGFASLAKQQALLDTARAAFARADYAGTLEALNAHYRRYPKSVLGEEREALEIKTLAAVGRDVEAKTRASQFKTQYPQSLLLPSVSDSVGSIP